MLPLNAGLRAVLETGPAAASKLFALIVRQASHGPIHPKPEGVATPPEILEACGLDVGEFYHLLDWLVEHGLVEVGGEYPFEEIRLTTDAQSAFLPESNQKPGVALPTRR